MELMHWKNGQAPDPPYYATIFSSLKHDPRPGYAAMDDATMKEVEKNPGYLGYQVVHNRDRTLFIAYWKDMDAINNWKNNTLHQQAKKKGKESWYDWYRFEICRVEEAREMEPRGGAIGS